MSQDTASEHPAKDKNPRKRQDWTAFDLEMINCAKHQYVVTFFLPYEFSVDVHNESSSPLVSVLTGTILIVDKYFIKMSVPNEDGGQLELWIAKAMIGLVHANKPKQGGN